MVFCINFFAFFLRKFSKISDYSWFEMHHHFLIKYPWLDELYSHIKLGLGKFWTKHPLLNELYYHFILGRGYHWYLIQQLWLNPMIVFTVKLLLCLMFLIFIRGGVPRYRYDFLTKMGWVKFLFYVLSLFLVTFTFIMSL